MFLRRYYYRFGIFELDEGYWGAKRVRGKRGRGAAGKTPMFGLLKKDGKFASIKPKDYLAHTPLAKLLAKAYIIEKKLMEDQTLTFNQFCHLHNILPRYLREILSLNCLSPRIKRQLWIDMY
jgi:hypothetical protein